MNNAFSRSWKLTKLTFFVIGKDKELFFYPILSGFFSIIFAVSMIFPFLFNYIFGSQGFTGFLPLHYFLIFITYLGIAIIATFFNVCIVYTVKKRIEGKNSTFFDSIKFSFSKIYLIFLWGITSAIVGVLLRIVENISQRLSFLGEIILRILIAITGVIWSLVTIFVVPSMVYYNLTPFDAIKKSAESFKKTWGENLISFVGFGSAFFLCILAGLAVFIPFLIFSTYMHYSVVIITILLAVIYFFGLILSFNLAGRIFSTVLFYYADTGKVPMDFDEDILKNAYKKKEKKFFL